MSSGVEWGGKNSFVRSRPLHDLLFFAAAFHACPFPRRSTPLRTNLAIFFFPPSSLRSFNSLIARIKG